MWEVWGRWEVFEIDPVVARQALNVTLGKW